MGWPPVQAETDHSNTPFMQGEAKGMIDQTIDQDAARVIDLEPNTLMAQNNVTRKWVPLTAVATGTNGESVPSGIYRGSAIPAASIVAGDVTGADILVGGPVIFDEDALVIENALTLDSIVVDTDKTIRAELISLGLNPRPSVDVDAHI